MFTENTYQMLKEHTLRFLTKENCKQYLQEQVSELDVFGDGEDIFINLHLPEANTDFNRLHGHDFFELNYVVKGSCRQNIDSPQSIILPEGSLCIMNPRARHNLYVENEDNIVINILMKTTLFNITFWPILQQTEHIGPFFLSYFLCRDTSSNFLLYQTQNTPAIKTLLDCICQEYLEKKLYYRVTLRCILMLFFTEAVRSASDEINRQQAPSKAAAQIAELFQYLSEHSADATLASTAEHFHYHPNYLSAFVKKHTGKTFRSILSEIKLAQANYLLTSTNLTISEVSERLGFQQMCNFYDFIRKNYHMTPAEYRRQHNGANGAP